ncbi:MAG: 50S ribosomal protein L23 [Spirochaetaceae bacterium]|jgi:large subunit ribosomal protein L23|nr:50S ribosomal protein L23 [Spirochaetaceae bacterium]
MEASQIILEPVLTEKSNMLKEEKAKKYVFKVHKKANKIEVIKAVESLFSVKPISCNILNIRSKKKANKPVSASSFRRGFGKTASWKKAVVTLTPGQRIDILEGA